MATNEAPRKMTGAAAFFEAGQRASFWAKQRWPRHAEKALQQELGISEWDAERILAGSLSKRLLELMLRKFGWRFAAFILEPYCGAAARLDLELIELKDRLARLEGELRETSDATTIRPADAEPSPGAGPVASGTRRSMEGGAR